MAKRTPKQARGAAGQHDWAKQMRFDMEYAKHQLLTTGSITPMFVIHCDDQIIPCVTDMGEKDKIRDMVTLICLAHRATGVTFIGEAWVTRASKDDHLKPGESWEDWEARTVPPSQSERRIEAVAVMTRYYDDAGERTGLAEIREIIRDATGKPTGLGEPEFPRDSEGMGPTHDILPPSRATPQQQDIAKELMEFAGIKPWPVRSQ
jgi:hypothetical protein